jgi:hypothetical protein
LFGLTDSVDHRQPSYEKSTSELPASLNDSRHYWIAVTHKRVKNQWLRGCVIEKA